MKFKEQSYKILSPIGPEMLNAIERAGRTCYQSIKEVEDPLRAHKFCDMLIERGHEAMLEFADITVSLITNRGVSHELVRHRLASYAQESTRYCKYRDDVTFIWPVWFDKSTAIQKSIWLDAMEEAETRYIQLLNNGWKAEEARDVLPNALKTEIVIKANVREWRNIFKLRLSKAAHPQFRSLMEPLIAELKAKVPVLFQDIKTLEDKD